MHWVSAAHAFQAQIRLYDRLFLEENPAARKDVPFSSLINPDSLQIIEGAMLEDYLKDAVPGVNYQFERKGYFCLDADTSAEKMVFNRTVTLKDSWQKIQQKG